jgi:hypothetical protein
MNLRQPRIAMPLAVAVVLLAAAVAGCQRQGSNPDRAETVGSFEIVTHSRRNKSGEGTTEHFSVRWKGEELTFTGTQGMFGHGPRTYRAANAVVTFPTPQPAFVVNVGDPLTGTFFFLVREVGGRAKAEPLGPDELIFADWIDPPRGDTVTVREYPMRRTHLAGGTLLLLGRWIVLDTRTLRSYGLRPHGGAQPISVVPPGTLSPDRRSFARPASGPDRAPLLLVHTYAAGVSYTLPIDRRVMRFTDLGEIDRGWLDHHFQWRSVDGGPERLVPREGVAPLPYHVRRYLKDDTPSFEILPVKPEMKDTLIAFLQREMDAVVLFRDEPRAPGERSDASLRIEEEVVFVRFLSPWSAGGDPRVVVLAQTGAAPDLVTRIADRFDAELRTGRHDALFGP